MAKTKMDRLVQCFADLEREGEDTKSHCQEISKVLLPRRGSFLDENDKDNKRDKYREIIGAEGLLANRTLSAGLYTGLINPYTVWAKANLRDQDLVKWGPVKNWLDKATKKVMQALLGTNFYRSTFSLLGELGGFGTIAQMIEPDDDTILRFTPFTMGQYYIARGYTGKVNTFARTFKQTASQMVEHFGRDAVTSAVKSAWDRSDYTSTFEVTHVIKPNDEYDEDAFASNRKMFSSSYWQTGESNFLRESGYDEFPIISTVWEERPGDTYGGCPGMDALGTVKMLQALEVDKLRALKREVDPPLIASPGLRNQEKNLVPGGVTYDSNITDAWMRPVYTTSVNLANLGGVIGEVRSEIQRLFFSDLFFLITQTSKEQTATEVLRREQEKLWMLGPMTSRFTDDFLKPIFFKTFQRLLDGGHIPEPPPEIQGQELELDYLGPIAQAQQASGLGPIEQMASFIGNLSAVKPEALDRISIDDTIELYGEKLGVDSRMITPIQLAESIRQQRMQQQAQAQQIQQTQIEAQNAKLLSETEVGGGNSALQLMLGQS